MCWWEKCFACVRGDDDVAQLDQSTPNASGQLDLHALLSSLHKEQQAPFTVANLEERLAHSPPILVARATKVHAPTDTKAACHSSDIAVCKSTKQQISLPDPSKYVSMVRRLQEIAAPAKGDNKYSDSMAKALRRRQGSGRRSDMLDSTVSFAKPAHTLTLSYANPASIEVFGGAEGVRRWVDAHISQNPLLLWQLSRSDEGEVHQHCLPGQCVYGGVLPLSVVSCQTQDMGPVLIIGVHCQGNYGKKNFETLEGTLQTQQQKQRQKQPELGAGAHARKTKSLDWLSFPQKVSAEPADMDSQHQYQEFLHLAIAHLPFAVTLIDSSGQVFWQNGRSASLLGLLVGNNKARDLRQSLQRMFILDPDALESLINALQEGQAWSGLVQVPPEECAGQSAEENAAGASMEGTQTLAFSASAEDAQRISEKLAADSAKCQGSYGPEREPLDVSHQTKESEGHAPRQEVNLTVDGPRLWSQAPHPSLGPQAASPAGSSFTSAASAAAAGQAGDRKASAADGIKFSMPQPLAAGFSFPENLEGAPQDSVAAVLPVPEMPKLSEADAPMLEAIATKDGGQFAAESTVRLDLSPPPPASKTPQSGIVSPFARASRRHASSHAMSPLFKRAWRPSEPQASDPLPKVPAQHSLVPAPLPWLQERGGQQPPQQRSDPIQRLPMKGSAESPVLGSSLRDSLHILRSIVGESPENFRRHSSRSVRRSVHTSGVLLEQDMVLSGASRALRMSSSQIEVGSLNYLAQSQDHVFSGATLSAAQPPAHYFDSIPEGRQEKEAHNSLPSAVEKTGEVEACAEGIKPLETGYDTRHTCDVASMGLGKGWLSKDGGSKAVQHGQSSSAVQLPVRWGASQRDKVPTLGAHHAECHRSKPLQKQISNPVPTGKPLSRVSEAQCLEGRQSTRFGAQISSASASLLPDAHTGSTGAPLLSPQVSVPSGKEEQNDAPSASWHNLEAFTIKRPDGGKVTVLTNQDVTSWVDSQMRLKQILDVEHKILEDIFPKHVLETQVAAGAEARAGRSTESGFNSPMLSKRGSNQSLAWSADKDCRSHRSSRLSCMTPDTSHTSRSELLFNDGAYKIGSRKGSHLNSGASSPLPQAQSQRSVTSQRGLMSDRMRSMNSSMKSSQLHPRLSAATTGSTDEASGLLYFLGKIPSAEHSQHDDLIAQGTVQGTLILDNPGTSDPAHPGNQEQSRGQQVSPLASSEQMKRRSIGQGTNVQVPTRRSSPSMGLPKNVQAPPKQATSCNTGNIANNNSHGRFQAPAPTMDTGADLSGSQGSGAAARDPGLPVMLGGMGRHHEKVTVMFADIKNFTAMSRAVSSVEVMHFLHTLFSQFDALVDSLEELGLYKVETIGDCYMCAAGLLARGDDGAKTIWSQEDGSPVHHLFTLAREMLEVARNIEMPASGGQPVVLRIGMHTGPVTSGIAGRKCPRFCLFGDTVNFAARMESTCLPGMIHVSQATWEALGSPDQAADPHWTRTSGVMAKGIGFVQTCLWNGRQ